MKKTTWLLSLLGITLFAGAAPIASYAESAQKHPRNETRHLLVNGEKRTYKVHRPAAKDTEGLALVIVFHGALGNGGTVEFDSKMSKKADEKGFVVAYPNGSHGVGQALLTWNAGTCCGPASKERADDMKFLRQIIEDMQQDYGIDPSRVYVTGLSNGGMLAYRAACEMPDLIAAVAPVDACMQFDGPPKGPISVLAINGTRDSIVLSDGGTGNMLGYKVNCPSAEDTIKKWAEYDGCKQEAVEKLGPVVRETFTGGLNGTEVCLYTFPGRHVWPGGASIFPIYGFAYRELDASDVIWSFFERHPKNSEISLERCAPVECSQ